MKHIQILLAFLVLSTVFSFAQECTLYVPDQVGSELEYNHLDKKGKVEGITKQEVTEIKQEGGATVISLHQVHTDEKGNDPFETDTEFKCIDGTFYVDMDAYINDEQMEAFQDMEMKVTTKEMSFPSNPEAGQSLEDGNVTITITSPMPMTISIDIVDRKIEAIEEVTTPAGTFTCFKLTETINMKSILSTSMQSVGWYSEGIGTVKSESYRKGKLMGSMELTAIKK